MDACIGGVGHCETITIPLDGVDEGEERAWAGGLECFFFDGAVRDLEPSLAFHCIVLGASLVVVGLTRAMAFPLRDAQDGDLLGGGLWLRLWGGAATGRREVEAGGGLLLRWIQLLSLRWPPPNRPRWEVEELMADWEGLQRWVETGVPQLVQNLVPEEREVPQLVQKTIPLPLAKRRGPESG